MARFRPGRTRCRSTGRRCHADLRSGIGASGQLQLAARDDTAGVTGYATRSGRVSPGPLETLRSRNTRATPDIRSPGRSAECRRDPATARSGGPGSLSRTVVVPRESGCTAEDRPRDPAPHSGLAGGLSDGGCRSFRATGGDHRCPANAGGRAAMADDETAIRGIVERLPATGQAESNCTCELGG